MTELLTIREAAAYMKISPQGILVAIYKHRLKAAKKGHRWYLSKEDMDEYRIQKFSRYKLQVEGKHIWDIDAGRFSPPQIAKILSEALGISVPVQQIYYAMRCGYLKSHRVGGFWVILQDDAIAYLERLRGTESSQLELGI